MIRRPTLLAALALLALAAPRPAAAVDCARLATRLSEAEATYGAASARAGKIARAYADRCVRLNQMQVLGSHNSYHLEQEPALMSLLLAFSSLFEGVQYTHLPLDEQFATQGIRQIELDVFHDPNGGLYHLRRTLPLVGQPAEGPAVLLEPGLKVLHIQDVDFRTTCLTFTECLQTIRRWSDQNRGHLPIMVLVEAKDEAIPDPGLGFTVPLPIDATALDTIDAEIRAVFPRRRLITPDDVRGTHATLEEAVLTDGWPTLKKARGRVLFALDNGGGVRDTYLAGRPSAEGRVLFPSGDPGDAHAAFSKRNDPFDPAIPGLVAQGYVVRTRADADTVEARTNDTGPRDAAIASGAQWVSTDYPVPDPRFSSYMVAIPDGHPARCNPISAPAACRSAALERIR